MDSWSSKPGDVNKEALDTRRWKSKSCFEMNIDEFQVT